MSDLLFRGRGADIGGRAPTWQVRLAGAVLGLGLMELLAALGVFNALGMGVTTARGLCLLAGAILAPTAIGAWLWYATAASAALLLVVSYTPVAAPLLPRFVRHDAAGPAPEAVMVFSGAVTSEGRVMGDALDRLLSGMSESRRRGIPSLALSVVGDEDRPDVPVSERDQRELAATFAPEPQLYFVRNVFSTRDEALAFAALARTHGWRRVLAVTSPSHTRRACAALEHEGLSVECMPAVSRRYGTLRPRTPEDRRLAFNDVLYETAATLLYRLRDWM